MGVISDTQRHCAKQRQALQAQLSVDAQKSLDQVAAAKAADDKLRTSTYARQLRDEDQRAEEVQAYMRSQEYRTITNFHNLSRCQRQRWAAKQKKASEKGENGSDTKTGVPISENPPVSCVEELQLSEADLAQISAYLKQLAK